MAQARKMVGYFCESVKAPKSKFDPRSFRYKKSGSSWILIGCPKGQWQPRKKACKVGTRAHKILRNVCSKCPCKKGEKRQSKGR
jgi:hypothetical protein